MLTTGTSPVAWRPSGRRSGGACSKPGPYRSATSLSTVATVESVRAGNRGLDSIRVTALRSSVIWAPDETWVYSKGSLSLVYVRQIQTFHTLFRRAVQCSVAIVKAIVSHRRNVLSK